VGIGDVGGVEGGVGVGGVSAGSIKGIAAFVVDKSFSRVWMDVGNDGGVGGVAGISGDGRIACTFFRG
jgi:hypothetical protein